MAVDMKLLQGEVKDHSDGKTAEVEKLLIGFLRALLEEQQPKSNQEVKA